MKKFIIIFAVLIGLSACYTEEDKKVLQKECIELQKKKSDLWRQIDSTCRILGDYQKEVKNLQAEKLALQNGRDPKYIIKVKIKQGTFTLDPFEHIKNEANAMEMELPVDKDFYNKAVIGTDLLDKLKVGSLLVNGDISWLHFKIIDKYIK